MPCVSPAIIIVMKNSLKLLGICLLFLSLPMLAHSSNSASAQTETDVYVVEIDEDIKAGTVLAIDRAINLADKAGADYLIIELDTPGGLLGSTRQIVDSMLAAEMETVVYVPKAGGWALSAGAIIMLAADHAYLHPTASVGAAQPYSSGESNEVQDEKAVMTTASWVRGLAERKGRDPDIASSFVLDNLTLSGREAHEKGVAEGTAASLDEVLASLGVEDARVERIEPTLTSGFFNFLSHPFLVSLMLTLGGLSLVMAVRSGEFAFSTAVGVVLLLVGLWGIGIIEFSLIAVGLLIIGVLLVMIEMFDEPGFGIFGIGGIASIFVGVMTMNQEPFYAPRLLDAVSLSVLLTLAAGLAFFLFVGRAVAKSIKSKVATGPEALVGKTATASDRLDPKGGVKVDGENWTAELENGSPPVEKGDDCVIMGVKGNTLLVRTKSKKG